ncbi:Phosphopantetheine-binding domain protein, partial [Candidatus Thiomargarita nelsonii]
LQNAYVAPRFEMEQLVANIWQEVFGIEPIGIHDNFYDLGGDSLIAIGIISRLRELFEVAPDVRYLFEKPTVASIAGYIKKRLTVQNLTTLPNAKDKRTEGEL